jgi:hypothetical protein
MQSIYSVYGCDYDPLRDFHEYHSYWSPLGSVIVLQAYCVVDGHDAKTLCVVRGDKI